MSILTDIIADDSQWFCNSDEFAENVLYTPYLKGKAQTPVTVAAIIDRVPPEVMREAAQRVKQIRLKIGNNAVNGLTTRPLRDDKLVTSWQVGEPTSVFRVVDNATQDAGMWALTAEVTIA